MAEHLAEIRCDPPIERKIRDKHRISISEVREALEHPAKARTGWDEDPEHGRRLIAVGAVASGRRVIAWLLPSPEWDPYPEVWIVKTARWVDDD